MSNLPRKKAVMMLLKIEKDSAYINIEMNGLRKSGEYDENYFKGTEFICVWIVVSGYIGLISVLLILIYDSFKNRTKHTLTKLIYKIVNIGVKEKDENR